MRRILPVLMAALLVPAMAGAAPSGQNFQAHLSGDNEVPPRDTDATGQAKFRLNRAEDALDYRLIAANIENVVAAHIHCGEEGANGPVGVTLFGPAAAGGGSTNGVLARDTITQPDAGNACGWADLAAVIAAMQSGDTYVNVHTNDGEGDINTGPGDFPGGEIRGQIQPGGPTG